MKKLILKLLDSKPTKRQANKFIQQQHELLFIITRHLNTLDHFKLFNSIVYFDSTKKDILSDIYRELEQVDGIPTLLNDIDRFEKTPIVAPIVVEDNKKRVVGRLEGLQLALLKLQEQSIYPKRFLILNEEGGLGLGEPFINIHDTTNYTSTDLQLLKQVMPRYGMGIIASHKDIDTVLKMMVTGTIPNESLNPPTLVRNIPLSKHTKLDTLNLTALQDILQNSFGKTIKDGYIDSLSPRLLDITIVGQEQYDGVVIITREQGYVYLDKFAVRRDVQGEGVAEILWNVVEGHGPIVWRSKSTNPANGWYANRCDGFIKRNEWVVFWKGDHADLEGMVDMVAGLEATF